MREAFRQLAVERLVVSEPNRAVLVSELSIAEVSELIVLRCLLEIQMMLWSMPGMSREDLSAATGLIDAIDNSNSVDDICQAGQESEMRILLEGHIRRTVDVIVHHLKTKVAVTEAKSPGKARRLIGAASR